VVATDSFRHRGKTDRIAQVLEGHPHWRPRLRVITHDLAAPFTDQTLHHLGHIDYVLALASESHVDRSIDDPVPFTQNNVNVALSTLELCRKLKPKHIILVSTDEVYGPEPVIRPRRRPSLSPTGAHTDCR
jgi:dTDP-glucose 4,6-dehydratase